MTVRKRRHGAQPIACSKQIEQGRYLEPIPIAVAAQVRWALYWVSLRATTYGLPLIVGKGDKTLSNYEGVGLYNLSLEKGCNIPFLVPLFPHQYVLLHVLDYSLYGPILYPGCVRTRIHGVTGAYLIYN